MTTFYGHNLYLFKEDNTAVQYLLTYQREALCWVGGWSLYSTYISIDTHLSLDDLRLASNYSHGAIIFVLINYLFWALVGIMIWADLERSDTKQPSKLYVKSKDAYGDTVCFLRSYG